MKRRRDQRRAFTLLELILALALASVLSVSLYRCMGTCLRARRTATAAVQPVRAATIAMDLICRDLESVPAPTGILAGAFIGYREVGAAGNADVLDFFTIGSDGTDELLAEGVRHVELALRTDVTPQVLVRRVTRNLLARTQVDPEEEILCRHVRSFSLRYFDGLNWMEEWDSTALGDVLPTAVEVRLEMGDGPIGGLDEEPANRILRIIPLACAKPAAESTGTTGTGSGSTGQSGTADTGTGGRS